MLRLDPMNYLAFASEVALLAKRGNDTIAAWCEFFVRPKVEKFLF